jgi:small subunit ribosomal protein S21
LHRKQFNNHSRNYEGRSRDPQGLRIEVKNNDVGKALRKLKKIMQADGILQEVRDRQYYTKPSEQRRKAKKAGIARQKKRLAERMAKHGY